MQSKVVSSQRVFMYHSGATYACPDPFSHSQPNEQELRRRPKDSRGVTARTVENGRDETAVPNFSSTEWFTKNCVSNSFRMIHQRNKNVLF